MSRYFKQHVVCLNMRYPQKFIAESSFAQFAHNDKLNFRWGFIYICANASIYPYIYICKCMWIDTHTHIYIYIHIYLFIVLKCIYIYISIYLSIYLCVYVCRLSDKPDQGSPIAPLLLQASGLCPSRRAAVPAPASPRERGQSHGAGTQLQEPGPETGHTRTIHLFKL